MPVTLFQEPTYLDLSVVISDLQVRIPSAGHLMLACRLEAGPLQLWELRLHSVHLKVFSVNGELGPVVSGGILWAWTWKLPVVVSSSLFQTERAAATKWVIS